MSNTKTSATPFIILILFTIAAISAGIYFSGHMMIKPKPVIFGNYFDKAAPVKEFSLVDHQGKTFNTERLKGHWTFILFGTIQCPKACQKTLRLLKNTAINLNKFPTHFANTQFVFISADPASDTPAKLAKHMSYFEKNFIGVTGPRQQLITLATQFRIPLKAVLASKQSKQEKQASNKIILINPKAQWQAAFRYPHNTKRMLYDYHYIREYEKSKEQQKTKKETR